MILTAEARMLATLLRAGAISALSATVMLAQTTVFSSFGPGDSFRQGAGLSVAHQPLFGGEQAVANGFTFAGPSGLSLSGLRFAAGVGFGSGSGDLFVTFLTGADINTASPLESWTVPMDAAWVFTDRIFSLTSVNQPVLHPGSVFWVSLVAVTPGLAAFWNFPPGLAPSGFSATSSDQGATWSPGPTLRVANAFDIQAMTTVPEPGPLGLVATGLVGLGLLSRRRKGAAPGD